MMKIMMMMMMNFMVNLNTNNYFFKYTTMHDRLSGDLKLLASINILLAAKSNDSGIVCVGNSANKTS